MLCRTEPLDEYDFDRLSSVRTLFGDDAGGRVSFTVCMTAACLTTVGLAFSPMPMLAWGSLAVSVLLIAAKSRRANALARLVVCCHARAAMGAAAQAATIEMAGVAGHAAPPDEEAAPVVELSPQASPLAEHPSPSFCASASRCQEIKGRKLFGYARSAPTHMHAATPACIASALTSPQGLISPQEASRRCRLRDGSTRRRRRQQGEGRGSLASCRAQGSTLVPV
tara:strand:+ start:341 stop:1015 length:675 start_codon:yes stop_codon:yes gene_type:complete